MLYFTGLKLTVVRYIRLLTSLLNSVGSTLDPLSSLLNFNTVMTGVGVDFEFTILNIFNISYAYLECEINMQVLDWYTYIPKEYIISLKSVISNSSFMTVLNSSMPKSSVNIKSSTYKQTINTLPC